YIASEDETVAWGAYDPQLDGQFTYDSIEEPSNFNLNVGVTQSENYRTGGDVGFTGLVPFLGSSYELRFDSLQDDNNSSNTRFDPTLASHFILSLAQPLLKDLFFNDEWTKVQTSYLTSESALDNFRKQVMDTVKEIASDYWILIANEEKARVAEKSLERARALLEQTKTQFEVGVISKVEVVESEAGVADREFNLILAQNAYRKSQDDLIDVVLGRHFAAVSTLEIAPTDRPEDYVSYEIDVEESARKAFAHRPELAVKRKEFEQRELELAFARNQRLPQLDFVVSYGNRGLAGDGNEKACNFVDNTPNPSNPGGVSDRALCLANAATITSGYGETFDGFFTPDASEQVTVGAVFSIPIPNTSARATASKRELELRKTRSELARLEQDIILEVRKSVRDLESAQQGIRAAERGEAAATEQLRAERIRLE
ncbi:MAG: TolC family protein, partial [Vicinamibacteria bacterium]